MYIKLRKNIYKHEHDKINERHDYFRVLFVSLVIETRVVVIKDLVFFVVLITLFGGFSFSFSISFSFSFPLYSKATFFYKIMRKVSLKNFLTTLKPRFAGLAVFESLLLFLV